jgi:hypothetical protein
MVRVFRAYFFLHITSCAQPVLERNIDIVFIVRGPVSELLHALGQTNPRHFGIVQCYCGRGGEGLWKLLLIK